MLATPRFLEYRLRLSADQVAALICIWLAQDGQESLCHNTPYPAHTLHLPPGFTRPVRNARKSFAHHGHGLPLPRPYPMASKTSEDIFLRLLLPYSAPPSPPEVSFPSSHPFHQFVSTKALDRNQAGLARRQHATHKENTCMIHQSLSFKGHVIFAVL